MNGATETLITFDQFLTDYHRGQRDELGRLIRGVARAYRVSEETVAYVLVGLRKLVQGELREAQKWMGASRQYLAHPAARSAFFNERRLRRHHVMAARENETTAAEELARDEEEFTVLTSNGSRAHEPGVARDVVDLRGRLYRLLVEDVDLAGDRRSTALVVWGANGTYESVADFLEVDLIEAVKLVEAGVELLLSKVDRNVAALILRFNGESTEAIAKRYRTSAANIRMRFSRGEKKLAELVRRSRAA